MIKEAAHTALKKVEDELISAKKHEDTNRELYVKYTAAMRREAEVLLTGVNSLAEALNADINGHLLQLAEDAERQIRSA